MVNAPSSTVIRAFAVLVMFALFPAFSLGAPSIIRFNLVPNPAFVKCLADTSGKPPTAVVTVVRGQLNDVLSLTARHIRPGLAFDLFTVERSNLQANGTPDAAFKNFGLAWYQSDLRASKSGTATVNIKTILLDQIFGFDAEVGLIPKNTFHVGFWFNNPADAANCGFDTTKPTPFNGDHRAGPLAMISLPNSYTGLGPLCANPNSQTDPISCNP